MDPLWMCRRLRESHNGVPVLVMSGEGKSPDPISALNAGADDFLPRGTSVGELHARLRALARRGSNGAEASRLQFEELELDVGEHAAKIGDRVVRLTRTEFELLHLFMRNPRRVLTHELIYERVWGYDFALAGNTLRVYIGYLRRKLEANGERPPPHTAGRVGNSVRGAPAGPRGGGGGICPRGAAAGAPGGGAAPAAPGPHPPPRAPCAPAGARRS